MSKQKCLILLRWIAIFTFCQKHAICTTSQALFQDPEVFLTVSSYSGYKNEGSATILLDRRLELNWKHLQPIHPEGFVALFRTDPSSILGTGLRSVALDSVPVTEPSGRFITSIRYVRQNITSNFTRCLNYWIAYAKNETVLYSNCLRIYPTWMKDIKGVIEDKPMHSIMIPGSHNAGSWRQYEGKESDNILVSYVICQEDSVYHQLIHGIRYLDIRAAYYPSTKERFWINHDQFKVRPLGEILQDVKQFVFETNEIVFVDFHRFPEGFNPSVHAEFIEILQEQLGPFLAPTSLTTSVTPKELWGINKTILLGYADDTSVSKHNFLWPNVQHEWANANKIDSLQQYLNESHNGLGCTGKFWAAMAELSAQFEDILFRSDVGIRGFAGMANPKITEWYQQVEWYSTSMIVATDYYLGNNIIEISYKVNKNNAVCVGSH